MDVIRMNEETKLAEIQYPQDCQVCNLCVVFCPVDAVAMNKEKYWPLMTAWG
jgi:NAD-dependent dihydropyrimidine dehydrogenase PreA subunit